MVRNREKGPDAKEEEKEIVREAEETLEAQNILTAAMEGLESEEEIIKAEEEAYKEKEEREGEEIRRLEEEDRRNRMLEHSMGDGAGFYMEFHRDDARMKVLAEQGEVSIEDSNKIVDEANEYLRDKFGVDWNRRDEIHVKVDSLISGISRGTDTEFDFGVFREPIDLKTFSRQDNRFTKEKYLDLMREITRRAEEKWEKAREDGMDDVEGVIPEELELSAVEKHLEGFAIAALEHDDIDAAVGALVEAGLITKKEYAEKVAKKMKKLVKSSKAEDRLNAVAAKERLDKYFGSDNQEEKEGE